MKPAHPSLRLAQAKALPQNAISTSKRPRCGARRSARKKKKFSKGSCSAIAKKYEKKGLPRDKVANGYQDAGSYTISARAVAGVGKGLLPPQMPKGVDIMFLVTNCKCAKPGECSTKGAKKLTEGKGTLFESLSETKQTVTKKKKVVKLPDTNKVLNDGELSQIEAVACGMNMAIQLAEKKEASDEIKKLVETSVSNTAGTDEEAAESEDDTDVRDLGDGAGRRGAVPLIPGGSFGMASSNTAGNDEALLGDSDDDGLGRRGGALAGVEDFALTAGSNTAGNDEALSA